MQRVFNVQEKKIYKSQIKWTLDYQYVHGVTTQKPFILR